jgi:hypothetical protein
MSHVVFISYAREDAAAANAIVDHLQRNGISCWIDSKALAEQHGAHWRREIVAAIEQSKVMIVVFSAHANASKYVASEVECGFDQDGLGIIPFRIEDVSPQDSLKLCLPANQWLDAFPVYEDHLGRLTNSVCRLLDMPVNAAGGTGIGTSPVSVVRWLVAHTKHLVRRFVTPRKTGRPARQIDPVPESGAGFVERKRVRDEVSKESLRALASANRWWRIKELIDLLEAHGLPLERYAEAKPLLEKKLAAFRQSHDSAVNALSRIGPSKIGPYIEQMRGVIADHPDIDAIAARIEGLAGDRGNLRDTLVSLSQQQRWTGVENAVRAFALGHGQATASVLQAAETASHGAIKETRRFDLVSWTLLAGAAMLLASYGVVGWLGMTDGSFVQRFPDAWQGVLGPVVSVFLRFGTAAVTLGFLLAVFGVRHQGTFAGASIGLMIFAAAVQAIPGALMRLPGSTLDATAGVISTLDFISCAIYAVALVATLQFAACRVIGASPSLPGLTAALAAALASLGFMPHSNVSGMLSVGQNLSRWLPDGFACAALLSAAGVITRRKAWWLVPALAGGLGVLGPMSDQWSGGGGMWMRALPVIVCLIVAGWMATLPKTLRGYLVLVLAACVSCIAAETLRGIDARNGMMPYGRLAPMLSLWAIACGTVAIRHKGLLSSRIHIRDMIAKQVLRLRCMRSDVHGRQLAETQWYLKGQRWHTRRAVPAPPRQTIRPTSGR